MRWSSWTWRRYFCASFNFFWLFYKVLSKLYNVLSCYTTIVCSREISRRVWWPSRTGRCNLADQSKVGVPERSQTRGGSNKTARNTKPCRSVRVAFESIFKTKRLCFKNEEGQSCWKVKSRLTWGACFEKHPGFARGRQILSNRCCRHLFRLEYLIGSCWSEDKQILSYTRMHRGLPTISHSFEVFVVEVEIKIDFEVVIRKNSDVRILLARSETAQRSRVTSSLLVASASAKNTPQCYTFDTTKIDFKLCTGVQLSDRTRATWELAVREIEAWLSCLATQTCQSLRRVLQQLLLLLLKI